MVDVVFDTAASHKRGFVIEVMGEKLWLAGVDGFNCDWG